MRVSLNSMARKNRSVKLGYKDETAIVRTFDVSEQQLLKF